MTIKHLFPDAWPTLNLDFANELALDPRITFSRSSIGTYTDKNGIIQYAAEDEPRFDYDPLTGESLGLLIEESRTNDTYPSTFDGTTGTWRYTNYVTPNQTTAPDGTNTGALLDFEMVGASGNLNFNSGTPQVSGTRSFSFWCKTASPSAGTEMKLELVGWTYSDGATGNRPYTLDFDTETKSTSSDFEVQAYPNGWYRCMISNVSQSASANGYLSFRLEQNPQNWYIWGMQSEEGTFPTSYIPTNGTAEDRDADICTIEGDNFSSWYNPNESTFALNFTPIGFKKQGGITTSINLGRRRMEFQENGEVFIQATSNAKVGTSTMPAVMNELNKYCYAFEFPSGSLSMSRNGANTFSSTPDTAVGMPNNHTELGLGYVLYQDRGVSLNGHIARLSYYPRRLSDEQLQALTS